MPCDMAGGLRGEASGKCQACQLGKDWVLNCFRCSGPDLLADGTCSGAVPNGITHGERECLLMTACLNGISAQGLFEP